MSLLTQLSYSEYRDSQIILVDVLGMRSRIRQIANAQGFDTVASVLGVLREQAVRWSSMDGRFADLKATAVSDSLAVSLPFRSDVAAISLAFLMHGFQYDLFLHTGHLLRGYMTRGALYHEDGILFGEGHLRALEGEERLLKGGPPRIVIDPELVALAQAQGAEHPPAGWSSVFEALRQDQCDGHWFIDFLKPIGLPGEGRAEVLRNDRGRLRALIASQIEAHRKDRRVRAKYAWLRQYEAISRADFDSLLAARSTQGSDLEP